MNIFSKLEIFFSVFVSSSFFTKLKLWDIIQIDSTTNKDYDKKTFLIEYISPELIIIVNSEEKYEITIKDGEFTDESIESISLLSRSEDEGFVRQQNIETGDYLSIYFSGKKPYVLNGIVTNIEEDMIEISRIEDKEKFYIDFSYPCFLY